MLTNMRALAIIMLFAPLHSGSARCEEPATSHMMVIADNQAIAAAGLGILQAGGSAADAAVAVLMLMSVVEPQAAGLGGGAMLVHFDAGTHVVTAWDGRETAPAAAIPRPLSAGPRTGGQAVGVPGAVRMLEALHHQSGHLPWADLIAPAIQLASQGAAVSPDLAEAIAGAQDALRQQPGALSVFFTAEGKPLAAGSTMTNPALAQILRGIAAAGANGLLRGAIAAEIATAARGDDQAGLLTTDDLAAYAPRQREAVCAPYRWGRVCTTPPPGGGLLLLQTLGLLDHTALAEQDPDGLDTAALQVEAEQLALADAARYLGDPDFVPVPLAGLLSNPYLAARAQRIDPAHAILASSGQPAPAPPGAERANVPPAPPGAHGTASAAIIDAQGNAIAMTASLSGPFGAQIFVHGFPLNAALADFAPPDADPAAPAAANQIEPGKRPASAMAPAIIQDGDHRLVAVIGSSGGTQLPAYEAQSLTAVLAWHMDALHALALAHVAGDQAGAGLETETAAATLAPALAARGFPVTVAAMPSRTVLFALTPAGAPPGAADPRGQGAVAGR